MGRGAEAERALENLVRVVPTGEAYETAARLWRMFGRPDRAAAVEAEARRRPR